MKTAIAFAAGLGIGAGVAYVVTKKKVTKEFEEDINAIRELYMQDSEPREESREDMIEYCKDTLRDLKYDPDEDGDIYEDDEDPDIVNPVDEDDEDEDEEDEEDDESPSESPEGIEEVEQEIFFGGDYDDYSGTSITLYTDGVLTDEVEDVITNQKETFFGDLDINSYEPGDTIYLVNHTAMLKIELIVSKQSYKRDILGEE